MKKILIFLILLAIPVLGQQVYSSAVAGGDSIGGAFNLGQDEIPVGLWSGDSLRAISDSSVENKTVKFYVHIGDTTAAADSTWLLLTEEDDGSTVYEVTLGSLKYVPLDIQVFKSVIGASRTSRKAQVWIKPYVVSGVDVEVTLKLRSIIFK